MDTRLYWDNFRPIDFTSMKFSGGEIQVRLIKTPLPIGEAVYIESNITSSDKLMEVLLLTNALRHEGVKKIHLICPYLPYARQDRVCYDGEAFSLRVLCDILNAQKYESVTVWDVHSAISTALLNNVINLEPYYFIPSTLMTTKPILVSPDTGAIARTCEVSKHFNLQMTYAEKIRDPNTGNITRTKFNYANIENPLGQKWLIVDDICDGGRTFIELAKEMNRCVSHNGIDLYVTHGIFSKGFDVFQGLIDNIYVANCFVENVPDFVHIVGVS